MLAGILRIYKCNQIIGLPHQETTQNGIIIVMQVSLTLLIAVFLAVKEFFRNGLNNSPPISAFCSSIL